MQYHLIRYPLHSAREYKLPFAFAGKYQDFFANRPSAVLACYAGKYSATDSEKVHLTGRERYLHAACGQQKSDPPMKQSVDNPHRSNETTSMRYWRNERWGKRFPGKCADSI